MYQSTAEYPVAYKIAVGRLSSFASPNSFMVLLPEPLQCFPNLGNRVGILLSNKDPVGQLVFIRRGRLIFKGGYIIGRIWLCKYGMQYEGGKPGSM